MIVSLSLFLAIAAAEPVLVDRIVASVDARAVTRSMVDARMRRGERSRSAARDALITELVVQGECERLRITVEPDEVDRALQEVLATNNVTLEQLTASLEAHGYDLASYRAELRRQLLEMRWVLQHGARPSAAMTSAERGVWLEASLKKLIDAAREHAVVVVREGEP